MFKDCLAVLVIVLVLFRLHTCETRRRRINNEVLRKKKIAVKSNVKNQAYISLG